jgi:hypothetical protein
MPTQQTTDPRQAQQPPLTVRQRAELYQQYARTAHTHTRGVQKQAAPFAGMGLLVLAAAALNAALDASPDDATILGSTAATCVVIAVVAAHQMRRRLDDRKSLQRGLAFVTVAATWLISTAAIGLTWNAVAVLGILGTALSLHYLRKVRIPNTVAAVPVAPPEPEPIVDRYTARWDKHLGCAGGVLVGSKLESPEQVKAGWRYVLRLVPGKQSIAALMSVMILVRGGLGLTLEQDVIAERHPVLEEPAVLLTVVTKPQIKESHEWPGPSVFVDGKVRLGPYVDGEGTASWTVYNTEHQRMKGGFVQGGSNAGKTRLIEIIAFSVAASEEYPTVVWYGDGQGNSSSPTLMKHADWGAQTHEQICTQYACAQLVMELRQDENGLEERIGFVPTADRPGLLLILSECHKPLMKAENPERWEGLQKIIEQIAREGQKVGVAEILETQESTLGAFGGAGVSNRPEMIRSNLLMGNGIMMRSLDANAKMVFKVDDDPSQFPELPGYGLMVAGDSGGRSAPFRAFKLTDEQRAEWPKKIYWRSLDMGSGNAAGMPYLMRAQLAELAREEIRQRVNARRNGTYVGGDTDRIFAAARGSDGAAELGDLPGVAQFPVWNPATEQVQRRDMHDGHRKILAAVGLGIHAPTPIAEATGYTPRRVHQILDELMDEFGAVRRDRHGEYLLVEEPADVS